jgi:hypothetical protein
MLERVVGLIVVAVAGAYLTQALALPYGTAARPGAGFFPTFVALFGCTVGIIMSVRAFMGPLPATGPRETGDEHAGRGRAVSTIVVMTVFCLLLPWTGYPLVAFGFVAVMLYRLGSAPRTAAITGVLTAAISYYIFGVLLDVPLPRGPW